MYQKNMYYVCVCVCTYSNINVMFHLRAYKYIIIYNVDIIKNLKHTYINEIQMHIMFFTRKYY